MNEESDKEFSRRSSDKMIIILDQKFTNFTERYDRDVGSLSEWRKTTDKILHDQDEILREISPAYKRGVWVVGLITLGSVGMAVKTFWQHISWH